MTEPNRTSTTGTPKKPSFQASLAKIEPKLHHKTPITRANSCLSRQARSEYQARGAATCKFNTLHNSTRHINNNNNISSKDNEKHKLIDYFRSRVPQLCQTVVKQPSSNVSAVNNSKHSQLDIVNTVAKSTSKRPYHLLQTEVEGKIYKVLRKIGEGGSAKVYECFEPHQQQIVALKIIKVDADPRIREAIFNEQELLSRLQGCKYVVRMYGSAYMANIGELLIVMEKGDADLAQISANRSKIDGIFIRNYWHGMLVAVDEIHKKGVVHADLKPVNFILVRGTIKLIDFGIANFVQPDETSLIRDYQIGTINYMAPETLKNASNIYDHRKALTTIENTEAKMKKFVKYGAKADIWSLGCILYNFVYGRPPFDKHQDMLSKLQAITDPNQTIEFPRISDNDLLDTMKSCLQYDPLARPTAEDLLNHPFLRRVMQV